MSLNRDTWKINRRPKQIESFDLKQSYRPRKEATQKLGGNVNPTKEKHVAKKDDVVRYNARICKITYVHSDKTVNLTAHKGAPFNSQHTPIVDLEFANEDGSFAVMDAEPEITTIVLPIKPQSPPVRKLMIRPDETVIVFDYAILTVEARIVVQQKTSEIRERISVMRRSAIEIGQRLLEVKSHLEYGQWGAWLRTEFNWSNQPMRYGYGEGGYSDDLPHDVYIAWQRQILVECMRVLKPAGAMFYNHKWRVQNGLLQRLADDITDGFPVRQIIIWNRLGGFNFNAGYFVPTYEVIYLITKSGFELQPGTNSLKDLWNIPPEENKDHPNSFPEILVEKCILAGSTLDEIVLDPFMGSGTTAVVAQRLGRQFLGCDLSAEYVAQANKRLAMPFTQPMPF